METHKAMDPKTKAFLPSEKYDPKKALAQTEPVTPENTNLLFPSLYSQSAGHFVPTRSWACPQLGFLDSLRVNG